MRGAQRGAIIHVPVSGIIPACAGSTGDAWPRTPSARDHPACAGSTQTRRQNRRDAGDHPRMCGEHRLDALEKELAAGSSPHVRGAQGRQDRPGFRRGIIPACAGSTRGQRRFLGECRDHPRMCGEHAGHTCNGSLVQGSSPHVRGARTHEWTVRRFAGIIPACAGSTAALTLRAAASRDHPRMCGEHTIAATPSIATRGSSPHVRGAPFRGFRRDVAAGIIPACAGSTRLFRHNDDLYRDHPRMCGEHFVSCGDFPFAEGSSPHVRGAPVVHESRTL